MTYLEQGLRPIPAEEKGVRFGERIGFDGLRFEEVEYDGYGNGSHYHEETYLDFTLQGTIRASCNGRAFVRTPGSLSVIPLGERHHADFSPSTRTFQIVLPPHWIERLGGAKSLLQQPGYLQDRRLARTLSQIRHELRHRDAMTPLVLEGLTLGLIGLIGRTGENQGNRRSSREAEPKWLRQATEYLHAHVLQQISPDQVAAAVGVHPSHLMRVFRDHRGCTIGEYVRRLRIERATGLLTHSNASTSEIAHAVGFSDQSHFSRVFRSFTGLTPTEYRKMRSAS